MKEIPKFGSVSEGKVYHWKHGWIPLDHVDAPNADLHDTGPSAGRRTKAHVDKIGRPVDRGDTVQHMDSKTGERGEIVGFDGRTKINVRKEDGSHATWYADRTMMHNTPNPSKLDKEWALSRTKRVEKARRST